MANSNYEVFKFGQPCAQLKATGSITMEGGKNWNYLPCRAENAIALL